MLFLLKTEKNAVDCLLHFCKCAIKWLLETEKWCKMGHQSDEKMPNLWFYNSARCSEVSRASNETGVHRDRKPVQLNVTSPQVV